MQLEEAVSASFRGEIQALKPGNVSVYADGHDMVVDDFLRSAEAATPILCRREWRLGRRLEQAVSATREAVGCNTNLGMVLLFAPLVMGAEHGYDSIGALRQNLKNVLSELDDTDAVGLFNAIRLASPGGLGEADSHDVNQLPDCSVMEAMQAASDRDLIALQYVNTYQQVFETGFTTIKGFVKRWNRVEWATVACYLQFLTDHPDSHVARKHGDAVAEQLQEQSGAIKKQFEQYNNPEEATGLLQAFDSELKQKQINPGTSADLAATSLLIYNLAHNEERVRMRIAG